MCGLNLSTESAATTTSSTEETSNSVEAAEVTEGETVKETAAEQTKEKPKSNSTDSTSAAPNIELKIGVGPNYFQNDKLCHFIIEAVVAGSPTPEVEFSRDDSKGSQGKYKVEIDLKTGDAYTFTAKAKNSSGEKTAIFELSPELIDRNFFPSIKGTVGPAGYIEKDVLKIGDSSFNSDWRGRFAFDVSDLAGKQITVEILTVGTSTFYGNPCSFKEGDIVMFYNDFLPDLTADDYYSAGYELAKTSPCDADSIMVWSNFLIDKIREMAYENTEIQFGIGYTNTSSNMDNNFDGRSFVNITLRVAYIE
jgi:hypothetical protein